MTAAAGKLAVDSGAVVHESLLVMGTEVVHGDVVVNDGVRSAGELRLSHGSIQVDGDVELHGATRAGLAFFAGGVAMHKDGLRVGRNVRVQGFSEFLGGKMALAASGGLNASKGM